MASLTFFVASCNNNKAPLKKGSLDSALINNHHLSITDSLQLVHDIDSADLLSIFKNKTNIWLSKTLNNDQVKWDNFHLTEYWEETGHPPVLDTPATKFDDKFLTDYATFLRWSPDSSYLLDIGSYGVTMARDTSGKLYVESGDVDSEVRLFNNKENTTERLLFFGPSTFAHDAHWADSSKVALIGFYNTGDNHKYDTILWMINVKERFFSKYVYHK